MALPPPGYRQSAREHTTRECSLPRAHDPGAFQFSEAAIAASVPDRSRPHREAGSIGQSFLRTRKSQPWSSLAALAEWRVQVAPAMHSTGMDSLATYCLEPQTIRPRALQLPTQSPTRRPQNTARSSPPEVSRTVSADSVLGPGRHLTSMERARRSLYELPRPSLSSRARLGLSSTRKPATYNKGFTPGHW